MLIKFWWWIYSVSKFTSPWPLHWVNIQRDTCYQFAVYYVLMGLRSSQCNFFLHTKKNNTLRGADTIGLQRYFGWIFKVPRDSSIKSPPPHWNRLLSQSSVPIDFLCWYLLINYCYRFYPRSSRDCFGQSHTLWVHWNVPDSSDICIILCFPFLLFQSFMVSEYFLIHFYFIFIFSC